MIENLKNSLVCNICGKSIDQITLKVEDENLISICKDCLTSNEEQTFIEEIINVERSNVSSIISHEDVHNMLNRIETSMTLVITDLLEYYAEAFENDTNQLFNLEVKLNNCIEALEIIAGNRQCYNNLMSNVDIARQTLRLLR